MREFRNQAFLLMWQVAWIKALVEAENPDWDKIDVMFTVVYAQTIEVCEEYTHICRRASTIKGGIWYA